MNLNKNNLALTGGAAAAEALKQINPDVMPVYPITPQTPIIEVFAKMVADGEAATVMIEVESEHSAMSAAVGAQAAGARAMTASSSQGIMLMSEILPIASGMRLPILMFVSARAISAPINIHGDHEDVMAVRDLGWIQFFSENSQEVYDNTFIALKLAEKARMPAMVIMDGFLTSHSVENLEILETPLVRKFIGEYEPKNNLLDMENPMTFGPVSLPNSFFEFKRQQIEAMNGVLTEYENVAEEYEKISGRNHDIFESYQLDDAERAIVVAGSTAGTVKVAVDELREQGEKVGLLKIKLFRPFPYQQIAEALKNVKNIAVLDRTVPLGSNAPIFSEIINSLFELKISNCQLHSYIYGLGGREIFKEDIKKVFDDLKSESKEKVKYIGLK
ncbi:MAG: pyruvate ferredoxin oxidoreductase [Candidatus Moranbacteria bacterium]|nr:pyruvate ferredoxin oxidoreductase [Candidatus Moranbacteria bacterium]